MWLAVLVMDHDCRAIHPPVAFQAVHRVSSTAVSAWLWPMPCAPLYPRSLQPTDGASWRVFAMESAAPRGWPKPAACPLTARKMSDGCSVVLLSHMWWDIAPARAPDTSIDGIPISLSASAVLVWLAHYYHPLVSVMHNARVLSAPTGQV